MTLETRAKWLKFGSILLIGFAAVFFLTLFKPLDAIALVLLDLVFWPLDGAQSLAAAETQFLAGICAGLLAGWGVTIYLLTDALYLERPGLVRRIVLSGLVLWFLLDSAGSLLSGAGLNALFNVGFLVLFGVPLLAPGAPRATQEA